MPALEPKFPIDMDLFNCPDSVGSKVLVVFCIDVDNDIVIVCLVSVCCKLLIRSRNDTFGFVDDVDDDDDDDG